MKIYEITVSIALLLAAACSRDGETEGESTESEGVPTDLPCGGADLQTDDLNCGTCGFACNVWWPGTEYAAGGCVAGECGPRWTEWLPHVPPPNIRTCEQICAYADLPCVPQGCSGMTAVVCGEFSDFGSLCNLADPSNHALDEFSGECDDPIPYPENADEYSFIELACCCDF